MLACLLAYLLPCLLLSLLWLCLQLQLQYGRGWHRKAQKQARLLNTSRVEGALLSRVLPWVHWKVLSSSPQPLANVAATVGAVGTAATTVVCCSCLHIMQQLLLG